MKMNDINPDNRPIEKMFKYGLKSLSNEELLAILINTGTVGKSSLDLSYEIINSVPDFKSLLNLSLQELMSFSGIKKAKACRIEAAFELTRRLMSYVNERTALITPQVSINYIYPLISKKENEHILVIFLNNNCEIITKEEIEGGLNYIPLPTNDIIKKCFKYNARGIILAHNHPSGNPKPSSFDIEATNDLTEKLEMFDFLLFDHLIVGDSEYYSFNENEVYSISFK